MKQKSNEVALATSKAASLVHNVKHLLWKQKNLNTLDMNRYSQMQLNIFNKELLSCILEINSVIFGITFKSTQLYKVNHYWNN